MLQPSLRLPKIKTITKLPRAVQELLSGTTEDIKWLSLGSVCVEETQTHGLGALMKTMAPSGRLIVAANWPRTAPAAATCPPPD